jgi:hypothetical protein
LDAVGAEGQVVAVFFYAAHGENDDCACFCGCFGFFGAEFIQPQVTWLVWFWLGCFHIENLSVSMVFRFIRTP